MAPCRVQGGGCSALWAQPYAGSLPDARSGCCLSGLQALDQEAWGLC